MFLFSVPRERQGMAVFQGKGRAPLCLEGGLRVGIWGRCFGDNLMGGARRQRLMHGERGRGEAHGISNSADLIGIEGQSRST